MSEDSGGWCAPEQVLCLCGGVFDEDHHRHCTLTAPATELVDVSHAVVWTDRTEFELRPGPPGGMTLLWDEAGLFRLGLAEAVGRLAEGLGLPRQLLAAFPPLTHHWSDIGRYPRPVAGWRGDRYRWCPGSGHVTRERATHLVKTRGHAGRWRWCVCRWCATQLVQALAHRGVAAGAYRYRRTPAAVAHRKPCLPIPCPPWIGSAGSAAR